MARYENQLDIYINCRGIVCKRIYSTSQQNDSYLDDDDNDFGLKAFLKGQINNRDEDFKSLNKSLHLAYPLSIILCQNNSRKLIQPASKSSILIVNENISVPPSSQYVQFMNTIFEAQRSGIKINVLDLDINNLSKENDKIKTGNVLLKQAASITSGYFVVITSISEVIPVLLNFPEFSKTSFEILNRPKQEIIDFRGSCFCHGKVVDFGYVCSVCLSGIYTICMIYKIFIVNYFFILYLFINSVLFIYSFLQSL